MNSTTTIVMNKYKFAYAKVIMRNENETYLFIILFLFFSLLFSVKESELSVLTGNNYNLVFLSHDFVEDANFRA